MTRTPLLTRREATERLNVSESTLKRLAYAGDITEIRVGKRGVRIDPASIEAYIRANRRLPPGVQAELPS